MLCLENWGWGGGGGGGGGREREKGGQWNECKSCYVMVTVACMESCSQRESIS